MTIVIFDFDGTIANTFDILYQVINQLAPHYGLDPFSPNQANASRNLSTLEIFEHLHISRLKIPLLSIRVRRRLTQLIPQATVYPGIKSVILNLKKHNYTLGVLSSNSRTNVIQFLNQNQINCFDFIYGGSSLFGKSRKLRQIIKKEKLIPGQTYSIGDEPRDIVAAKRNHLISIAVAWGYKSTNLLQEYQPDYLAATPAQLLDIIQNKASLI